jgi:hypothetical protein
MEQLDKLSETSGGVHMQRSINILNKQIEQKIMEINEKKDGTLKIQGVLEEFETKFNEVNV